MAKKSSLIKGLESPKGKILFSILLGLGIAALFRKACDNGKCVVINGPNPKDLETYFYKMDGNCYKYYHEMTDCDA